MVSHIGKAEGKETEKVKGSVFVRKSPLDDVSRNPTIA